MNLEKIKAGIIPAMLSNGEEVPVADVVFEDHETILVVFQKAHLYGELYVHLGNDSPSEEKIINLINSNLSLVDWMYL